LLQAVRFAINKLSILKEFWEFLRVRKKWWLMPIMFFLLLLGFVLVAAKGSALAPSSTAFFERPSRKKECRCGYPALLAKSSGRTRLRLGLRKVKLTEESRWRQRVCLPSPAILSRLDSSITGVLPPCRLQPSVAEVILCVVRSVDARTIRSLIPAVRGRALQFAAAESASAVAIASRLTKRLNDRA